MVAKQEAGFAVLDGFRQPAGLVTDRERSEPLRIHLAQPAGFEPRRHQREIAAGKNPPRLGVVEADDAPIASGLRRCALTSACSIWASPLPVTTICPPASMISSAADRTRSTPFW